jgi:hypothetical protein
MRRARDFRIKRYGLIAKHSCLVRPWSLEGQRGRARLSVLRTIEAPKTLASIFGLHVPVSSAIDISPSRLTYTAPHTTVPAANA